MVISNVSLKSDNSFSPVIKTEVLQYLNVEETLFPLNKLKITYRLKYCIEELWPYFVQGINTALQIASWLDPSLYLFVCVYIYMYISFKWAITIGSSQ